MMNKALNKFTVQKCNAKDRGIEFHFTFKKWVAWWEKHLGPKWLSKRGRAKTKFVMARKEDKGAYEPSNVICITVSQNASEASARKEHSVQSRLKRSLAISGKRNPMYGKKVSRETRRKISVANTGQKRSSETRRRIREGLRRHFIRKAARR